MATAIDQTLESRDRDSIRVLVLDDDELVRKLATNILSRAGCDVETAADGREGLQLLLLRDFDVAVVDFKMSGMDGLAFLTEALTICPWLGVIIVTGFARDEAVKQAKKLGVDKILKKPFDVTEFREQVFAKAAEKQEKLTSAARISLRQIQRVLSFFQEIGRSATESESLLDAVRGLSHGLAFLESEAVAILSLEDEPILMMFPRVDVSAEFLIDFEGHVRRRYHAFSGRHLPSGMQVETDGTVSENGKIQAVRACFSVPVIAAGEIRGLLSIATSSKETYGDTDMLFLYHAANLLATVLLTFRRMRQLVVRDSLTGLYNQRGVNEQLESIWQLGKRYHYRVGIAMLDVDHFKEVNDSYGHPVGDIVLRELAQLVRSTVRASDVVGRYGGDEIVVIFPNAEQDDLKPFCERLRQAVHTHVFCEGLHDLKVTISIGLASSAGQDWLLLSSGTVISQADKALYAAKQAGRDRVSLWSAALSEAQVLDADAEPEPDVGESRLASSTKRGRVLIVDDEAPILDILQRMLEAQQYEVTTQATATGAIEKLRTSADTFDVIITDLTLKQDESGFDILKELRAVDDTIVPIVMTGHATVENAVTSLRHGAYDFIRKPIESNQLAIVLDRAIEYRRLRVENRRYQMRLEEMVRVKNRELATALEQAKQAHNFTLEAMVAMLDAREKVTGRHSINVRELALILGRELALSPDELQDLSYGALLHDIGKIAIPDAVLLKEGPLTEEEWVIMKTHPRVGYKLVSPSSFLAGAAAIVLEHQEKFDGTGYPRGLTGEELCLGSRIFSVVDAYDAMRSDRPYRKSLRKEEAVEQLRRGKGSQFDPEVVEAALRCLSEMEKIRTIGIQAMQKPKPFPGVKADLSRRFP